MLTEPLQMPKLPAFLERLFADPPPACVVEFSEQGIFRAATARPGDTRFEALPGGALTASPVENNFRDHEAIGRIFDATLFDGAAGSRSQSPKEPRAAVILPDYSARTTILDFEEFPARREEREPLVRFRLRKIVPYEIESARISFQEFPKEARAGGGGRGVTVAATTCPLHILAEYETLLRERGYQPGFVSSSALCAFSLLPSREVSVLAKRAGQVLTAVVSEHGAPRLMRTIELPGASTEEMLRVLQPMFALAEDQLGTRAERLWLCGFGEDAGPLVKSFESEFGVPTAELASRFGTPRAWNAGALGYLQGLTEHPS